MNKHATLYLYELAWMLPSVALPVGMLAALAVTAFGAPIGLPGEAGRADPPLARRAWVLPSVAFPVGMLAALAVTAFGAHIGFPGEPGRVDPATVMQTAP